MKPKQVGAVDLSCSRCGFRIYNRRYPKCEHCGFALPTSLLLSQPEREALVKRGEEQLNLELERARARRRRTTPQARPGQSIPGAPGAGADWDSASSSSDIFTSGGGGVFDGGGASGSFAGDSGSSSGRRYLKCNHDPPRRLTLPSSGRPPARCACLRPPLISKVRPRDDALSKAKGQNVGE